MYQRLLEEKTQVINEKRVYVGKLSESGQWIPDSLAIKYQELVRIEQAPEEGDPKLAIDEYEFVGGNSHRVVYVRKDVLTRWLDTAAQDAHWAAASVLRPGKLAGRNIEFNWDGYAQSDVDEGVLAVMRPEDWIQFVRAFDLPTDATLAQVTVFDLNAGVSAKGTVRKALRNEKPTVFPESWKRFGTLRTEFTAVLTVDSIYQPKASINAQEIQYWVLNRKRKLSSWVREALEDAIEAILQEKSSIWTPAGWLTALGFSASINLIVKQLAESQENSLRKLARRLPLSSKYGLRAKSTSSELLKPGEVFLPHEARKFVRKGDRVVISRNPALPTQDWLTYTVAGFVPGHVVYFPTNDFGWVAHHGGDHDGDDAVVLYRSPVEGEVGNIGLDLQAIKPTERKLGSDTVELRLERWKREREVNIGQFDLAARRLASLGKLTSERAELLTKAIQLAIALKKRVAKLEEQTWWPEVDRLLKASKQVAGQTDVDRLREFVAGEDVEAFDDPFWSEWVGTIQEGLKLINTKPRFFLTEEKLEAFAEGFELPEQFRGLVEEVKDLLKAKALAQLEGDAVSIQAINQRLKVLVHVEGPEVLSSFPEKWKQASYVLPTLLHHNVWVFWMHPEVMQELFEFIGTTKIRLVGPMEGNLEVGDLIEFEESKREYEMDGVKFKVADETPFITPGIYQVTKTSRFGATLERYE